MSKKTQICLVYRVTLQQTNICLAVIAPISGSLDYVITYGPTGEFVVLSNNPSTVTFNSLNIWQQEKFPILLKSSLIILMRWSRAKFKCMLYPKIQLITSWESPKKLQVVDVFPYRNIHWKKDSLNLNHVIGAKT